MDSNSIFSNGAHINWDKSNPNSKEDQYAKGNELGLVEMIRQLPCQKGQREAHASQDSDVSKNKPKPNI